MLELAEPTLPNHQPPCMLCVCPYLHYVLVCVYIYIYYVYIYIYVYHTYCVCIYIYIYTYIHLDTQDVLLPKSARNVARIARVCVIGKWFHIGSKTSKPRSVESHYGDDHISSWQATNHMYHGSDGFGS